MRHLLLTTLSLSLLSGCLTSTPAACETDEGCAQGQACENKECIDVGDLTLDACQAPPSTCADPDEADKRNDTRNTSSPLNRGSRWGCTPNDDFPQQPLEVVTKLCHDEPGDFYQLDIVGCRDKSYEIIATMTTTPACGEGFSRLRTYLGGKEMSCGDENNTLPLRCEQSGATLTHIITVPATSVPANNTLYFGVDGNGAARTQFEYDLDLRIEELPEEEPQQ